MVMLSTPVKEGMFKRVAKRKGLDEGLAVLVDAKKRFPDHPTVTYYLGTYNCAGGDVETARALVTEAIELDKSLQKVAIEDEDLVELWD